MALMQWLPEATTTVGLALFVGILMQVLKKKKQGKMSSVLQNGDAINNNVHENGKDGEKLNRKRGTFWDLPGPWGFPVIGNAVSFGQFPHLSLTKWANKYGPIFRIKLGSENILVLSSMELVRDALLKQRSTFAGRTDVMTSQYVCGGLSLSFSNYSHSWRQDKNKAIQALSLYTSGKNSEKRAILETAARAQADKLADKLINMTDPNEAYVNVRIASANVICTICFGLNFEYDAPVLMKMISMTDDFDNIMGTMNVINFSPWMAKVPFLCRPLKKFIAYMKEYNEFTANLLNKTWSSYDKNNLRHVADCLRYASENKDVGATFENESSSSGAEESHPTQQSGDANFLMKMHDNNQHNRTIRFIQDIYGAGFETMASCLNWVVLYLSVYEDWQQTIADEVMSKLDSDETPSLRAHGDVLVRAHSFMYEFLRLCPMFPMPIPHCTTKETYLDGYCIPNRTTVFFNFHGIQTSNTMWDDPKTFRPERFCKTDPDTGVVTFDKKQAKKVMTFGMGYRKCLGEQVAKNELFTFICVLSRRCKLEPYIRGKHPTLPWGLHPALTIAPQPYKIKAFKRTQLKKET